MKFEIGKQIETLRKELGVSTYELEQKGMHLSLPSTIEIGIYETLSSICRIDN